MKNTEKKLDGEEAREQENIDSELAHSKKSKKDAPKKHDEILREQIGEGLEIYDRSHSSIFISSLTAGLEIGFSFLLLCTLYSFFIGKVSEETIFKLFTFVYPLGFVMVILGKSILFTEQTSLLALPVLNKKRSLGALLKLWGVVIAGNLIGGYVMAVVMIWIGPNLGIFDLKAIENIAEHVVHPAPQVILVSAILAGWLMALLSWLLTSSKDTVSRLFIIYLITAVMSFTGLHHSILGSTEIFAALISSPNVSILDYFKFIGVALLGNSIGGFFFVAILKYRVFIQNVE